MIIIPGALTDAARRGLVTRNVALVARARKAPHPPPRPLSVVPARFTRAFGQGDRHAVAEGAYH